MTIRQKKKSNSFFGDAFIFQFLKFVKKIGDGELTIKDNEVIEKSTADQWVQEFEDEVKT